ncbi:PREDICTED: alpha-tocopherol transfer protein-like [Vollenhovia emeryi]|uniref:alpha-tocopherol transfer protein-like n=1 Tax=Vollenhovia emeryi TaxID=411798 RepID=UPI0005F57184|nr:PREDICTED: alpha-tocopherol transfer protein-like [Vollenhovia emeryi]XP_011871610.1 PREDICTED: alpha-tocopherol transfer protein-like [Vollenhovia emeryi]XP_011871611.1 PREDICTED: alpha-tocopherol transfer protein-like [Vollenhovia emeryi]XP_011871612.1 PREDICTED: alpha-tocopherol transfer protein-like [Vollenhovia emeryi]
MANGYSDCDNARQDLTSEDKRYAAAHLNETDETRESAIAEMRHWLKENDNSLAQIDDFFILRFLRVCKFNLEKTRIRMQNYYKQKSRLPEWYMNKDPCRPELQELLDMGVFLPLRKPDGQGRLVIVVYGTRHDPRKHKIADLCTIGIMAVELAMRNYPAASLYGCSVFINVANPTMRHALQLQPQVIMNIVHTWQSCYPIRMQSITMFNAPEYIDVVARIFRSFMTEKLKNRFHIYSHRTTQNCFEDIPANILPVEYGGTDGTVQELAEYWKKLIMENRDWLMDDENDNIIWKQ